MITNYHTHTSFCDGQAEPKLYAEAAVNQRMNSLGFSAHAPIHFPTHWAIKTEQLSDYHNEIHRLKREYEGQLDIYCGLEADFFPEVFSKVNALYSGYKWDYIIGSVHFIGIRPNGQHWCIDGSRNEFLDGWREITDNHPLQPIRMFFDITRQMVREMKPDVIGHLDKIKMQHRPDCMVADTHPFFQEQLMSTLEEIAATDCIVEINTRGIYKKHTDDYFPAKATVAEMKKMKIPVTVSSDAHSPEEIDFYIQQAKTMLLEAGYRTVMIFKDGKWEETEIVV